MPSLSPWCAQRSPSHQEPICRGKPRSRVVELSGLAPRERLECLVEFVGKLPNSGARSGENPPVEKIGGFGSFQGMSRLTIEIEPEQHRQIKTLATFAGMRIKEFMLSKTITPSSVHSQQSQDTTARLLGSPKNAKRLREAINSKTPKCLIFKTKEDLKRALGI